MINTSIKRGWEGLSPISKDLYEKTYFKPDMDYEMWLDEVTELYKNDDAHKERMKNYIRNYWFHPSTPISSLRGLPISCYTSHIEDNREGIFYGYLEGMYLGAYGGGRGVYWGNVSGSGRPIGVEASKLEDMSWSQIQKDKSIPKSAGCIPFMGVSDRATYAISQAGVRRSTEATYLGIWHSDIEDFIDIRLEAGDKNRRMHNLHHGVVLTDEFMKAVGNLEMWDLYDIHTGKVVKSVDAFDLWIDILLIRKTEQGEPYLLFIDNVNNKMPPEYKTLGLKVFTSNICTEITLFTDKDHSAICCLGSTNVEYFDEWNGNIQFIRDINDYLHNVLIKFLKDTDGIDEALDRYKNDKDNRDELVKLLAFERVRNSVKYSYDVGIGVMGYHSWLQKKHFPFESMYAKQENKKIFSFLRKTLDEYQEELCTNNPELICPMSLEAGTKRRNIHTLAVAPTMSISNLCNITSQGVEPFLSNVFAKTLIQGTYIFKNRYLDLYLNKYQEEHNLPESWVGEQWDKIISNKGSVQSLDFMSDWDKDVFATAFEISQIAIIEQAGDRADDIDQAQSINLFAPAEISYEELHAIHYKAWEVGIKSLYYLRSQEEVSANVGKRDRKIIELETAVCTACE